MSLPKGQRYEYRVAYLSPLGYQREHPCSGPDHAERLERQLRKNTNLANVRIERRPVGKWEAP